MTPSDGYELDEYSEEIHDMDATVTIISTLEILTGILGIMYVLMTFAAGFFPSPLAVLIAYASIGTILGVLAIISIVAGVGLWQLKVWAWRIALAANVAALVLYTFSLSIPFILLNAVLVWYLRTPRVISIYSEIEVV
ncbi:MAG: hypothetical protein ACFFDM_11570 [Candidatus Thorarchaeota archaeon]